MTELDRIMFIHERLVECFWVVGIGTVLLIALNIWYWRKS